MPRTLMMLTEEVMITSWYQLAELLEYDEIVAAVRAAESDEQIGQLALAAHDEMLSCTGLENVMFHITPWRNFYVTRQFGSLTWTFQGAVLEFPILLSELKELLTRIASTTFPEV